jgi:hypothetical protein
MGVGRPRRLQHRISFALVPRTSAPCRRRPSSSLWRFGAWRLFVCGTRYPSLYLAVVMAMRQLAKSMSISFTVPKILMSRDQVGVSDYRI